MKNDVDGHGEDIAVDRTLETPRLLARLFGDFLLTLSGTDVRPRGRKSCALLAFLLSSRDRSAARSGLADLLWSDRGDEQARNSLRQAIAEIRASPAGSLGAIAATRTTVQVEPGQIETDYERIEAAISRSDLAELAALLARTGTDFLADLDGIAAVFDEWLQGERVRRREHLLSSALRCLEAIDPPADREAAREILTALERHDPLNEAVIRHRLSLDHARGDIASVHRRYRRLVRDLAEELHVDPSSETRALFNDLIATAPGDRSPTSSTRPTTVKAPPTVLVTPLQPNDNVQSIDIATICSEDVRIALARNTDLRVLMVDSIDAERASEVMSSTVAAYKLSGSVRVIGQRTTVNVQLGSLASGVIVWSEQIRLMGPVEEIVDELTARIVGAVAAAIERDLSAAERHGSPLPHEAMILYARGRRQVREARTLAEAKEGEALLEEAIRQDKRHVGARLALAQIYNTDFSFMLAGHDVEALRRRATLLAEEAAAMEPDNTRVKLRLAWCCLRQQNWPLAERLFRNALQAMPHDADALNECGFGLAFIGELALAEELMQRAFQLNPFAPAEYHADHAVLLSLAGDAQAAEEHFDICGERRLLYQAVRVGNVTRLDAAHARRSGLQARFVRDLLAAWQPALPPTEATLTRWVEQTLCVRRPEHRQFILAGVLEAWAVGQAAPDSIA